MFIYPETLTTELKKIWKKSKRYQNELIPSLPNEKIIKQLVEICYHASFKTEEMRRVTFKVAYCQKDIIEKKGTSPLNERICKIKFIKPRKFNVSELIRLAPATDPTKAIICVESDESVENRLYITGLIDIGSSWWDFIHGESDHGIPPPSILIISSQGSGDIMISRGDRIVLHLRDGTVNKPVENIFFNGPISNFLDNSKKQLYSEIYERLKIKKFDPDGHDQGYPARTYIEFIERIIFHILDRKHGGTLIIIPDSIDIDDERLKDRMNIKYPCIYDRGWKNIIDYLISFKSYYDLYFSLSNEKSKKVNKEDFEKVSFNQMQLKECEESVSDSIKFISTLAGVDGAIVITDKLKLLGFGSEIIAHSPSLENVKKSKDSSGTISDTIPIESYGTRHRSAFRFCSSFENAIAFIISHDGGVTAVKRQGADLLIWQDINLGIYGN